MRTVDRAEIFRTRVACGGCGDTYGTVCRWCLKPLCITHLPPHLHPCSLNKEDAHPGTEVYEWLKKKGYKKVRGQWKYFGNRGLWRVKR